MVLVVVDIPDGKDATGLGEGGLLLDTTDSLLEDGRDLSGGGFVGVATERVGNGSDSAGLYGGNMSVRCCKTWQRRASFDVASDSSSAQPANTARRQHPMGVATGPMMVVGPHVGVV
jgi:hypothetical protein